MPHTTRWLVEKRVIHVTVWGDASLPEAYELNRELMHYLDAGAVPVHVLQNTERMLSMPTSLLRMKEAFTYVSHAHLGWMIFIGKNRLGSAMLQVASRLIPTIRYQIFATEEDAYRFLMSKDATLAGLLTPQER